MTVPTKTCSKCHRPKTLDQFARLREGWRSECLDCMHEASRERWRNDPRVGICVRLDPRLHERLKAAADERDVSMNWLIRHALADYLDRLVPADELRLTR